MSKSTDFESDHPGSNPDWGPIYYEASFTGACKLSNPRTAELFQLTFAAKGRLLQPPTLDFGLPDRISS